MNERGFDRFPRRILTQTGAPESALPAGERFVLRTWLSGDPPRLDLEHPLDLTRMARAVGEMHRASLGFHCPTNQEEARGGWPAAIEQRLEEMRQLATSTDCGSRFARLYQQAVPGALEEGILALALAQEAGATGLAREALALGGFCHGDLGANNALIRGQEAYLLDFDRAEPSVFAFDLATLLRRVLMNNRWHPKLAEDLLESYGRTRLLPQKEIRTAIAFLHWPQPLWRLGYQYFVEGLERSERFFLSRLWHWTSATQLRQAFLAYCRERLW